MSERTDVLLKPHFDGVYNALTAGSDPITAFPIGKAERPKTSAGKFEKPPYAILSIFPGGEQDGPINDSQADAVIRFRIAAAGKSSNEALQVSDACTKRMHRENITIANRKVRSVKKLTSNSGQDRDDDVATPLFFEVYIWEVDTVPA